MTPYPDYPIPADEEQRLRALRRFAVLDTPADPHFDRIALPWLQTGTTHPRFEKLLDFRLF